MKAIEALFKAGEVERLRLALQHHARVGVEGEHARGEIHRPGALHDGVYQVQVATVDAIKDTDRDHGGAAGRDAREFFVEKGG